MVRLLKSPQHSWLLVLVILLCVPLLRTFQYLDQQQSAVAGGRVASSSPVNNVLAGGVPLRIGATKRAATGLIALCEASQLQAINQSLPDTGGHCSSTKYMWYNKCPISQITGCPDSSAWLDWYHQREVATSNNFVAINIGCNKGFDAVNLLRMGSNDDSITRSAWNANLLSSTGATMLPSNCQQNSDATQYQITAAAASKKKKDAVVFCVEPLSGTYQALRDAAKRTEYDQRGLHVLQLAVNNEEPNMTLFPKASSSLLGAEKEGGNSCYSRRPSRAARLAENCEPVATTRLDRMVQQEEALRTAPHIHVLLVDVEGWDFEVLQGGMDTLKKTHYIEFEYNWRGMWWDRREEKPLRMAIDMLHNELPFTCYWPGGSKEGQLWRITGCWLPHYDGLFWSNVVCVNRVLAPALAERMEDVFLKTIGSNK